MPEREILRVHGDVRATYGKVSRTYAVIEDKLEGKLRRRGLALLDLQGGEAVLEIGFGTGRSLVEMARSVGGTGSVSGIDITPQMVSQATERLEREGLAYRVEAVEGDARNMPYEASRFDAVYAAGVLELFDTPDIPTVLAEVRRVLKPNGKVVLGSMPREGHEGSLLLRLWEWAHRTFPRYASCRPIYLEDSVRSAGYTIDAVEEVMLAGVFPMKLVVGRPAASRQTRGRGGRNRDGRRRRSGVRKA